MNHSPQLPADIIYEVFKYFDSFQIAKFERVCKQWKDVARNNQTLWRDGLFINKGLSFRFVTRRSRIRLEQLLKRSGRTLESLYLNLDDPMTVIKSPFHSLLLRANIQNLWIRMVPRQNDEDWIYTNQELQRAYQHVIYAVEQSTNLKSLHLEYSILGTGMDFGINFHSKPLARCRLERLTLSGFQDHTFLSNYGFIRMVSKIRVLQLNPGVFSELLPCKSILRLLHFVKDTLEELLMTYDWEVDWRDKTAREVTLPKLTKLRIVATNHSYSKDDVHFTLHCPNLRDLTLDQRVADYVLLNWQHLYQGVETLRFFYGSTYSQNTIIECLKRCKSLRCLSIMVDDTLDDKSREIGDFLEKCDPKLIQLPIERLEFICFPKDAGSGLMQFIKGRLDDPLATKIKSISIRCKKDIPKKVSLWLSEHVADCEIKKMKKKQEYDEFKFGEWNIVKRNPISQPMEYVQ